MFGLGRVLTFTSVVVVLFTVLIFNSFWSLYSLFRIPLCELKNEKACIRPYFAPDEKLDVRELYCLTFKRVHFIFSIVARIHFYLVISSII